MRYTVTKSYVYILGRLWMNQLAAKQIELSSWDLSNAKDNEGNLTRDSLQDWLDSHEGDFREIIDLSAGIEDGDCHIDIPWNDEENEFSFNDCMYPNLDED